MVTFRIVRGLWILRSQLAMAVLKRVIRKACDRFETRIIQFAILGNHLHLIVETSSRRMLSKAMKGFGVRVAKNLNIRLKRRGRVIAHRHHTAIVRSVEAAQRVIRYVRENFRRHFGKPDEWRAGVTIDRCSSWANIVELPAPETDILLAVDPFG